MPLTERTEAILKVMCQTLCLTDPDGVYVLHRDAEGGYFRLVTGYPDDDDERLGEQRQRVYSPGQRPQLDWFVKQGFRRLVIDIQDSSFINGDEKKWFY